MTFKEIPAGFTVLIDNQEMIKINPDCFLAKDKNLYSAAVTKTGELVFISPNTAIKSFLKK